MRLAARCIATLAIAFAIIPGLRADDATKPKAKADTLRLLSRLPAPTRRRLRLMHRNQSLPPPPSRHIHQVCNRNPVTCGHRALCTHGTKANTTLPESNGS